MRIISWIWFWYILVGFIMGGRSSDAMATLKSIKLKLLWFEWLLTILCFIVFMFMSQTFIASFQEFEPQAAWLTLVFMGLPIIVMGVVLYRSLNKRYHEQMGIN